MAYRHAAKPCIGLIVFVFYLAARWFQITVKRLTRRHRQARNLVLGRLSPGNCHLVYICRVIHRHTDIRYGDLFNCWASAVWQFGFAFRDILPKLSSRYPDFLWLSCSGSTTRFVFKEFEERLKTSDARHDNQNLAMSLYCHSELSCSLLPLIMASKPPPEYDVGIWLRRRYRLGEAVNAGSNPQRERGLERSGLTLAGTCG